MDLVESSRYKYYKKRYPKRTHEDIIKRMKETKGVGQRRAHWKQPIDLEDKSHLLYYQPPDGEIITQDDRYIYYKDKVWSKTRSKLLKPIRGTHSNWVMLIIQNESNEIKRMKYQIGTIPKHLQKNNIDTTNG